MRLFIVNQPDIYKAVTDTKRFHQIAWCSMSKHLDATGDFPLVMEIFYRAQPGGEVTVYNFEFVKSTLTHGVYRFVV